jgi:hypothetical protein
VLRHRQAEARRQARARRLVHLAVDATRSITRTSISSQRSPPRGPPADTGEHDTPLLLRDVVDQSWIKRCWPGAAEQADLAAAHERCDQIDDLDPRLEDLRLRRQLAELGWIAVDR